MPETYAFERSKDMRKKKVTSSDIAHAAGVSQATVSMILNKKYNVSFSKETIRKVEQIAEEMGYEVPKRKTRRESRKEKLIVVFCSNLTNPYYVMLLQGIESRAKEQGYGLFVCNTQRDLKMEERYLRMMHELKPLGIIYTCNPSHSFMDTIEELAEKIPIVIINNQNEHLNVDAVELDNSKLGRTMAKHLLELINDVLEFNKLDEENLQLTKEPFCLKKLWQEIITIVEPRAADRGVRLTYEEQTEGTAAGCVLGSSLHVRQIFINILGNAIKYTDAGGHVLCQVTIKAIGESRISCRAVISDNGIHRQTSGGRDGRNHYGGEQEGSWNHSYGDAPV